MTNGITYDPQNKCWIMQCGSTNVFLDRFVVMIENDTGSRANHGNEEETHAHLRTL